MESPATSVSLLKDLAHGADAMRWGEFYKRYAPLMRTFLYERYPAVDADDVMQETMLALTKAMPNYRYTPDVNGHFRNYLTGIVNHKALDAIRRDEARRRLKTSFTKESREQTSPDFAIAEEMEDEKAWQMEAMEAALEQIMADAAITPRTREVFRHVALMHERPEDVAKAFGMRRNAVDQIKSRMLGRLADMISAMTAARGI